MIHKILTTVLLMICISASVMAAEKKSPVRKKERVLIFNLQFFQEGKVDLEYIRKNEGFEYYTFIIPHTLTRKLNDEGSYTIQRIESELQLPIAETDRNYLSELQKIGKNYNCRYIIFGRCGIVNNKLTVNIKLVNAPEKKVFPINLKSDETGAVLRRTIDDLSEKIKSQFIVYDKTKKEPIPPSPFKKFYKAIDGLSFGVRMSKYFIKGGWEGAYTDAYCYSPYVSYDILPWLGASIKADYIPAENRTKFIPYYTFMRIWGVSASVDFSLPFLKFFSVSISPGGGFFFSKIRYIDTELNPFQGDISDARSNNFYFDTTAAVRFRYNPVQIEFGSSYKLFFFKGSNLHLITVFFGAGYHL